MPSAIRCCQATTWAGGCVFVLLVTLAVMPRASFGDAGDCGQPLSAGSVPVASDCLFILQAAVSLLACEPECICAPKGSLPPTATDALLCLGKATGQDVPLHCPCASSTTTTTIPTACNTLVAKWGSLCKINTRRQKGCIDPDGAGPLGLGDGQFFDPWGLAVDQAGHVYVADAGNDRMQKFDADGGFLAKWGTPCRLSDGSRCADPDGSGPLEVGDGQFSRPSGVAVDQDGNVYVADDGNNRVQKFDASGNFLSKWGSPCFVLQIEDCIDPDGEGPLEPGDGQFVEVSDVAVDGAGFVYVPDGSNHRIQKFDSNGAFITKWTADGGTATRRYIPRGIAVDGTPHVYSTDGQHQIKEFDANGVPLDEWGGFCRIEDGAGCVDPDGPGPLELGDGQLFQFNGKLATGHGNQLYAVDDGNSRVQSFETDGTFLAKWGSQCCLEDGYECIDPDDEGPLDFGDGQFCSPTGVAAAPGAVVYLADAGNQRIQKFACR